MSGLVVDTLFWPIAQCYMNVEVTRSNVMCLSDSLNTNPNTYGVPRITRRAIPYYRLWKPFVARCPCHPLTTAIEVVVETPACKYSYPSRSLDTNPILSRH